MVEIWAFIFRLKWSIEKDLFQTMKITLLTLAGLFILSACAQAVQSVPSPVIAESPTSTKSVETPTPNPSQTPHPTPTEWIKVYPTKKAILIYGESSRNEYTLHFIEWGDFYLTPRMVLYEDGQLILGMGAYEKQLSQAETQTIVSKLEQLGFPKLQEAYDVKSDSIFTVTPSMDLNPSWSKTEITLDVNGPKSITYHNYWGDLLTPPMKDIISYLANISSTAATPYQPDRLLVSAGDVTEIPEGKTVIPWPEGVTSPLHRSYMGVFYLEGDEASKLYNATGEYLSEYFSYEGKIYEVNFRPILPHECHTYHLYEETPPAQPSFTCDDW
ncbi:MAG TPA: hypothetical protein PLG52_04960 [Anaerolineales bacterium]|nr:hypothetical protein [Anaerolineales bacterium]